MLARAAQLVLERSEPLDKALHVQITGREVTTLDLPPVVTRLLMDVLKETAAGKAVSLVTVEAKITTHQAALILNVSRPYLIGMIDKGTLPVRMVGQSAALAAARRACLQSRQSRQAARDAAAKWTALDQELGLYERRRRQWGVS